MRTDNASAKKVSAPAKKVTTPAGTLKSVASPKPKPASKKPKLQFKAGDYVVYPTHGVGLVQGIEKEVIEGHKLELVVVTFDNDRDPSSSDGENGYVWPPRAQ